MLSKSSNNPKSSEKTSVILVGGAKGSGKTTLLKPFRNKFKVVFYSELLKSSAKQYFGKNFLRLNLKERDILRKIVVQRLIDNHKVNIYLWEVHFCCYEFGRKRSVIPENLLEKASGIIFIVLDETELKRRRTMDKNKKRSHLLKTIKRDLRIELEYAKKASRKFNIPLFLYKNNSLAGEIYEVLAKIIK